MPTITPNDPMPITLSFKKGIRSDGELFFMAIIQDKNEIRLTREQAQSLVRTLDERFSFIAAPLESPPKDGGD